MLFASFAVQYMSNKKIGKYKQNFKRYSEGIIKTNTFIQQREKKKTLKILYAES